MGLYYIVKFCKNFIFVSTLKTYDILTIRIRSLHNVTPGQVFFLN